MTEKLITSNYLFIQLPCNLFPASIENKSWGSSIWHSYISLLLKPPEHLDSVQLSWKETVNQPTPPYNQKTWDSCFRFLPHLKKDSKNVKQILKIVCTSNITVVNPSAISRRNINHKFCHFCGDFQLSSKWILRRHPKPLHQNIHRRPFPRQGSQLLPSGVNGLSVRPANFLPMAALFYKWIDWV